MTKLEALKIPSLNIEVTPEVEDAFYAWHYLLMPHELPENFDEMTLEEVTRRANERDRHANNAKARVDALPLPERTRAEQAAYTMIQNIKKYGIPCVSWMKE